METMEVPEPCEMCHEQKPDVYERVDALILELDGVEYRMFLCDDCDQERKDAI